MVGVGSRTQIADRLCSGLIRLLHIAFATISGHISDTLPAPPSGLGVRPCSSLRRAWRLRTLFRSLGWFTSQAKVDKESRAARENTYTIYTISQNVSQIRRSPLPNAGSILYGFNVQGFF